MKFRRRPPTGLALACWEKTRMAISLTCECGKKLAVKDELAGKRVKCPGCGELLTVPSVTEEAPLKKRAPAAADDEEDQEDERPRKKKKKRHRAGKSNKTLWIGAGIGVLVLGFCCLGIGGASIFWFTRGGPEKPILGKWGIDMEAMKKNNLALKDALKRLPPKEAEKIEKQILVEASKFTLEIKADGTFTFFIAGNRTETSKWRNATAKGDIITLETLKAGFNDRWETFVFKVIDIDHIQCTPPQSFEVGLWLKRL
jgi:hypothetical protein